MNYQMVFEFVLGNQTESLSSRIYTDLSVDDAQQLFADMTRLLSESLNSAELRELDLGNNTYSSDYVYAVVATYPYVGGYIV